MRTTTASEKAAVGATQVLALSFELGATDWKMALSPGLGQQPRHRTMAAGNLEGVMKEIGAAKTRFKLPADVRVVSCRTQRAQPGPRWRGTRPNPALHRPGPPYPARTAPEANQSAAMGASG